jgi:hypothetical protein
MVGKLLIDLSLQEGIYPGHWLNGMAPKYNGDFTKTVKDQRESAYQEM